MAIQAPSSSSFTYDFSYDVFISFRGPDTRFGFTGNLYKALIDKGIRTFIDDKDLQRGDEITPSLLKSIEDSRIAIIVFSKDYASSSFCLDELVHVIDCSKAKGRVILPVFYGTNPSHIRHLNHSYGEALAKHEGRFQNNKENMERLQKWKIALKQTANLSGYHFNLGNEYECDFIGKIVKDICNKINRVPLHVGDYLVGLESQVSAVNSLLNLGSNDGVCIVGIHGTGGMGKTTLARAVYNLIGNQFECLCFLHNVRANSSIHGLEHLQEQLLYKTISLNIKIGHISEGIPFIKQRLSQKKVLLILDDVGKLEQLRSLVGEPDWLGPGSKVIITTRDKHLLSSHGVGRTYEVYGLNKEEALELFRWKVCKNKTVDSSYEHILNRAVTYASGLPLAIEVVGSNLSGKHISEWESTLDKYERIPHQEIQRILKISFDDLDEEEQSLFLDIACCFNRYKLKVVEEILHVHYSYCIKSLVGVLVEKSLMKINWKGCVTLHDLVEDMGKEIVRQESPKESGNRSRLWFCDDIVHVLKENTGTRKIEIIHLNSTSTEAIADWNGKALKNLKSLKTLIILNGRFSTDYLPSSLRVMKWKNCPLESVSSIFLNKKFENMKALAFDDCEYLTNIPDVSGLPNLENFSFEYCRNLITIHNSIGYLCKLESLNAYSCKKLESFPPLLLPSLKKLDLNYCENLKSFPDLLGKMTNIKAICIDRTSIQELPFSFQNLSELGHLYINGHGKFWFSSHVFMMPKLSSIISCYCGLSLPRHNDKLSSTMSSNVEYLRLGKNNLSDDGVQAVLMLCYNVKYLFLSGNNFKILPECLKECHLMRILELDVCKSLEEIRGFPPNLKRFSALQCQSLTFSCRRMLLSQQLHEVVCTEICLPTGNEGIPDWFEHQVRGQTISFWFRKEIPTISSIILFCHPALNLISQPRVAKGIVNLFVNGSECTLSNDFWNVSSLANLRSKHTFLFDLKLEENIKRCKRRHRNLMSELDEAILKKDWIHVELKLENFRNFNISLNWKNIILWHTQIGIHVIKKKSSKGENVIFTNPYSRKRKLVEYLNASLSQKKRKQPKFSIPKDLVPGMQNLVLTETKENENHG